MVRNASETVIRISDENPHYFQYKGKEILLITSAEHYGAVVSRQFDYVKYLHYVKQYDTITLMQLCSDFLFPNLVMYILPNDLYTLFWLCLLTLFQHPVKVHHYF